MKRWILGVGLGVLVLAVATSAVLLARTEKRTLVFLHEWNLASDVQALERVLGRFHSLYPQLTVRLERREGTAFPPGVDLVAASGFSAEQRELLAGDPVPWTGGLWLLAARKDVLDSLSATLPTEVAALRSGQADPAQFRRLLESVAATGKAPLTVGNSHRWPFLVWLQHWAAATLGPETVDPLPTSFEALAPAFQELVSWKAKGWFAPSVWAQGWAQGLQPLDTGAAAFALVSQGNFGTIQARTLSQLEFLPFPREAKADWSVGSVLSLAVAAPSRHPEQAQLLLRYLTSPGVTAELTALTGRPFFAWTPGSTGTGRVLASWAEAAMTADYNALSERFDPSL